MDQTLPLLRCPEKSLLLDKLTGVGKPIVDYTNFISWSSRNQSTFTIAIKLAKPDNVTHIDIYFYNSPHKQIGLPSVSKLEGSRDSSLEGALRPIHFIYSGNSRLNHDDDDVVMVSVILTTDHQTLQFKFLKLTFDFSKQFVKQTFISEIVIQSDASKCGSMGIASHMKIS